MSSVWQRRQQPDQLSERRLPRAVHRMFLLHAVTEGMLLPALRRQPPPHARSRPRTVQAVLPGGRQQDPRRRCGHGDPPAV